MKLLTIVPARAGSKGIKNKNFINFLGKPLIEHTLDFAKKIRNNKILICSDYKNIKKYEKKFQTINGYVRPKKLSKDNTMLHQTLYHAIKWILKEGNIDFDYILVLQPTSPIRLFKDFKNILKILKKDKPNSICSVVKVKHHPEEYLKKVSKNRWSFLIKSNNKQRQNYDNYFFIDGSFYLIKKNFFLKNKQILTKNSQYFPLSISYPVDLDDPIDLKIAEVIYKFKNANTRSK
tara:strand:+ start:1687 stop:2388 length:702 start_codon:yes stop_codon:yes gene_type:complete